MQHQKSTEQMEIDEFGGDEYFDNLENNDPHESVTVTSRGPSQPLIKKSVAKTYLTKEEFDYTMKIFDGKINSIYKLCRYISDKQNESSKDLKRLITLDELSEDFWNVSNLTHFAALFQPLKYLKKILIIVACLQRSSKEITSCNLVPTVSEFRKVLEDHLSERAGHFIDSIGKNSWVSMFEDKL